MNKVYLFNKFLLDVSVDKFWLNTFVNDRNLSLRYRKTISGQEILKVINYSTIFPSVNAQFSSVCVEELVKLIVFRYLKLKFLRKTYVFLRSAKGGRESVFGWALVG
jgi:hypothetical protein